MEEFEKSYEMITTIVNEGFSDIVMQAAKENGARGGTIYKASGTGNKDYQKFYGVEVSPDKEVIVIIVEKKIRDKIMRAIYEVAGLETKGAGICYSLPLEDVYGLKSNG